jgi:hypothetical protein
MLSDSVMGLDVLSTIERVMEGLAGPSTVVGGSQISFADYRIVVKNGLQTHYDQNKSDEIE